MTIMANAREITAMMDAAWPQGPRPAGTPVAFVARMAAGKPAVGELLIYDEIAWYAITSASVAAALSELAKQGARELHVFVNSPGGDVFEGVAILNSLRRFAGKKTVFVDGLAASMASVIAMAGDRIVTAPNAMWMVHNPWSMVAGDGAALRARADLLDELAKSCVSAYAARTGRSADELQGWMDAESWMSAEVALARGFTDEIAPESVGTAEASAPDLWPTLAKFKSAPPEALRLLSLRASARTPAASSRTTPAVPAKEQTMDLKALLAKAVAAGLISQAEADAILATTEKKAPEASAVESQVAALAAKLEQLTAAAKRPVQDPSANLVADAAEAANEAPRGAAPRISKFHTPRAAVGREKRSNEAIAAKDPKHASSILAGMPLARAMCALGRAQMEASSGMGVLGALEMMGFLDTAESIARGAAASPMSEGDAQYGGPFVPAEILAGFIDSLEYQVVMRKLIPAGNIIRSKRETVQITKLGSGPTASWVGENPTTGNPGKIGTGVLTLRARKMRVEALISRDQLRDAASNVDQIAYQKLATAAALLEDKGIVEGKGTENEPKGLKNWASYNTGATGSPDYEKARKDLRGMLKKLETLKVPGNLGRAFVGSTIHKYGLGDYVDAVGAHPFERELEQDRLIGQPAAFSGQFSTGEFHCFAPGAAMLFDQLEALIESDNTYIGTDGVTYSASASDEQCLRLWRRMDFGMAHNEAAMYLTSCPWGA